MSNINFIKTAQNLTVFIDGRPVTMPLTDHRVEDVLEAIRNDDVQAIRQLINFKQTVAGVSEGRIEFDPSTRSLTFNGEPLHNAIIDRLCALFEERLPVTNLLRFLDNLMDNPDYRAVNELYRFIEACDLPITPDGHFLAYKIVRSDYLDIYTGTFDNSVGNVLEMPRNQVNPDPHQTCSHGLHVCSREYLPHYGGFYGSGGQSRIMVAKVHPRDVVAVPMDYNNAKMRVCRYEIVDEIPFEEVETDRRMTGYVTDSYGSEEADDHNQFSDDWSAEGFEDSLEDDHEWEGIGDDDDDEAEVTITGNTSTRPAITGKLSEHQVRDIDRLLNDGEMSIAAIGRLYKVNESTIRKIRDGLIWSHVTGR